MSDGSGYIEHEKKGVEDGKDDGSCDRMDAKVCCVVDGGRHVEEGLEHATQGKRAIYMVGKFFPPAKPKNLCSTATAVREESENERALQ
jgi:hypothetical protein